MVVFGSGVDSDVEQDRERFVALSKLGHGSVVDRVAAFGVLLAEYFIEPRDNAVCILFKERCDPNIEVLMSANGVP